MNEGFSEKFDDGPFNKNECLRLHCFKISRKKENLINIHFECTNNDHILNKHLVKMNEINGLFRNT